MRFPTRLVNPGDEEADGAGMDEQQAEAVVKVIGSTGGNR